MQRADNFLTSSLIGTVHGVCVMWREAQDLFLPVWLHSVLLTWYPGKKNMLRQEKSHFNDLSYNSVVISSNKYIG